MNANLKRTMIALAVAALFSTSMAYAQERGDGEHSTSVEINKKVSLRARTHVDADIDIKAKIAVNSVAIGLADTTQSIHDNETYNKNLTNTASIDDNAAMGVQGNIGANVAAGDNNAQSNSGAIAATDASFAFGGGGGGDLLGISPNCNGKCGGGGKNDPQAGGMADAEVFTRQTGKDNFVDNDGSVNSASIDGNAFENAKGNIGVNVAAGDNNEQSNSLAAASATNSVYSTATASTDQKSHDNTVHNDPLELGYKELWQYDCEDHSLTHTVTYTYSPLSNTASLGGNAFENAQGNVGVNIASGTGNLQSNSLSMAVASASH
ncbi:hypothetical protein [Dyella tabacisoli]|uniref:Adhesin n=1 Tax=Dyella tabacisoli TaxID=2282381 RepID=A0A369UHP5_9GAMM|nr:hypothetical protein [Dyella tabacisoli]RDD80274.1 hypothetical protein DVJ77_17620 [Dyella tabacisoli]